MFATIVALATANLNAAIHIIRISGSKAFEIINKVLNKKVPYVGNRIFYRYIQDEHKTYDEVLINTFTNPHSFTGEDSIEINCHGGVLVAHMIIELLIKNGCEYAQRGEFSRRALMNKKMDLTKVEAINNLIHAQNEITINANINALKGWVGDDLKKVRKQLFEIIGQMQVNIDYPEYDDVPEIDEQTLISKLLIMNADIKQLLERSTRYMPINDGIKVLIIGQPNVGKSTLLNALANEEKAIVTNIPGTTRDVIETVINIDGFTLKLFDTAGIHQTDDQIEQYGINKALNLIDKVDLILYLIDNDEIDHKIYDQIKNRVHLIVHTKKDLQSKFNQRYIYINAQKNDIQDLIDGIKEQFKVNEFADVNVNVLSSHRQIGLLKQVHEMLKQCIVSLENGATIDLVLADLEIANIKLLEILGENKEYDFLDELFANFCLGK
ncbi:tRNA uridine-5-carboxymethylaminomethyl(34) synthesis GTPase MnmE [Ureaplasma miroungigenitalium]|uniref:tRNA modification GTPase MnmE n=1 Tax=Ureaplasma miroungigenitalium TaxID=1042321 RepID=A0ABT3BMH5_9BACT|nr:tRNA uridine-5-carboxymethylaminomethyl(34) synthesis GTPase MnmE [Ureaplasma miroungigenitalium]MCV3728455.1 tRNA uridine-5-carboxymethylaminomethyl(34) synthesis GTPase MnmE [Ureaplasma miroungigenitalium]MCV3734242.1 tRNA uridine-5-carboxymethylaminomethyl(34) synthesis GTPase MnmE [Ureaplasma miroungigenitalium]